MDLAEEFVKHLIRDVREHCAEDLALFAKFVDKGLLERLDFVARAAVPARALHGGGRDAAGQRPSSSSSRSSMA